MWGQHHPPSACTALHSLRFPHHLHPPLKPPPTPHQAPRPPRPSCPPTTKPLKLTDHYAPQATTTPCHPPVCRNWRRLYDTMMCSSAELQAWVTIALNSSTPTAPCGYNSTRAPLQRARQAACMGGEAATREGGGGGVPKHSAEIRNRSSMQSNRLRVPRAGQEGAWRSDGSNNIETANPQLYSGEPANLDSHFAQGHVRFLSATEPTLHHCDTSLSHSSLSCFPACTPASA